jgi:enamine deaminase RidA (YjgF/YER057c/UK114 family)
MQNSEIVNLYKEILKDIKKNGEAIIFEKVFGGLSYYLKFNELRSAFFKEEKIQIPPMDYVEGMPVDKSDLAGIMIYTVKYNNMTAEDIIYYTMDDFTYAVSYVINHARKLYFNGSLKNLEMEKSTTLELEIKEKFKLFQSCLKNVGFKANCITRTWFYLNDIAENYKEFNALRREFFNELGIDYSDESNYLPASTCIEGKGAVSQYCSMNFYCTDTESEVEIRRIYNREQNEANGSTYLFKPTFSRAVSLTYSNFIEMQISGTASINEKGESVFLNNPYEQIKKTLKNVNNLLRSEGMNFGDIVFSTCFFKDAAYFTFFQSILEEMKLDQFPFVCVVSNICREDLLFEIDAIAAKHKESV